MTVNVVINMHFFLPISPHRECRESSGKGCKHHTSATTCELQPHKSTTANIPQIDGEAPFGHLLEAPLWLG